MLILIISARDLCIGMYMSKISIYLDSYVLYHVCKRCHCGPSCTVYTILERSCKQIELTVLI